MSIDVLTQPTQMMSIRSDWNRLAEHPMSSFEWLNAWQQTFGAGHPLHVVVVRDLSGFVIGIAPWYEDRRWGVTTLKFLGSGKACSDYAQILIDPRFATVVESELLDYVYRLTRNHAGWMFRGIEMDGIALSHFRAAGLLKMLSQDGFQIRTKPQQHCWMIDLPKTWEEFTVRLGSSFRRNVRNCIKRLDQGELTIRTCRSTDQWEEAREAIVRLHQARRSSLGEQGCFDFQPFLPFLDAAIPPMMEVGQAEVVQLFQKTTAVAAALILKRSDYWGVYQTGVFPESLHLRPGHTLNSFLIREAINSVRMFDFMRGDEEYKAHWRAQPIPLSQVTIVPTNRLSRLGAFVEDCGRGLTRKLRSYLA